MQGRRFFIGFSIPAPVDVHHDAYIIACSRVMTDVMGVVRARGFAVSVDIDPDRVLSQTLPHEIQLTYQRITCVVKVDHDTFMSPEFFRTRVLHQVDAALEQLTRENAGS